MIAGRPTNLWLGFTTALVGFASVVAVVLGVDADTVAIIGGSATGLLGAGVLLIANQPPTVNPGDTIQVTTPQGQPTATVTVPTP